MSLAPMANLTILRKAERLSRCIERVNEEYSQHAKSLESNYTVQDSIILNIQRACQQAIDIAQLLVKENGIARPTDNGQLFSTLAEKGFITKEMSSRLRAMVGFRNIAVHEYEKIDFAILHAIIQDELNDLKLFAAIALKAS